MEKNNVKLYQFRNQANEPISPVTDIKTIIDEKGPIKPRYDYIKEMLYNIIGDVHDPNIKYSWQQILDIINRLLIEYEKAPIYLSGELPPLKDREPNKVYLKYRNTYQTGQYGVRIDIEAGTVVRIGDNYGKSLEDFYNILPWAGRKRCQVDSTGNVIFYESDSQYDPSSNQYDTMVECQMFYYKRIPIKIGDKNELLVWEDWVSYYPHDGYSVHPSFIRDGMVKDKIYVGAYEGYIRTTKKLGSVPDVSVTRATTVADFRSSVNSDIGFSLFDIDALSAEQMLLIVSSASLDSQAVIGRGVSDISNSVNTGQTKNMGINCGSSGVNGGSSVNFFGIENLWGNFWTIIDNIYASPDGYKITDVLLPETPDNSNTNYMCINMFSYNSTYDYLYIPHIVSSTPNIISDYVYTSNTSTCSCAYGGRYTRKDQCGIFSVFGREESNKDSNICARLMYIPQ